jgi:hypothetical protein
MHNLPTTYTDVVRQTGHLRLASELASRLAARLQSQATTQHALLYGCLVGVFEAFNDQLIIGVSDVLAICRLAVPEFKSDEEICAFIVKDADSYADHGIYEKGEKAMTEIYFKLLKLLNPS